MFFKGGDVKRIFILSATIIITMFTFSCKEDFNPKTVIKDEYVVNCIISVKYDPYASIPGANYYADIEATIAKTYDVNGYSPWQQPKNKYVSGAKVYIEYRGDDYQLKQYTDTLTPRIFYYLYSLTVYPSFDVYLYIKTPDGKVLTSKTRLPDSTPIRYSYPFRRGFSTLINRFSFGDYFVVSWDKQENCLFFPKLSLGYSRYINTNQPPSDGQPAKTVFDFSMDVPNDIINKNFIYSTYTFDDHISYNYSVIDSVVSGISSGDTAKHNYRLDGLSFSMIKFGESLSKYYTSVHGAMDNYSLRLDESVYSNINGGIGIFGSKLSYSTYLLIDPAYAHYFGYEGYLDKFPPDSNTNK